jgi:prevent-host-death family protein
MGFDRASFSAARSIAKFVKSESMKSRISATEAARSVSDLMNRVRYRGKSFVVERNGRPICAILPAKPPKFSGADLARLPRSLPKPDESICQSLMS